MSRESVCAAANTAVRTSSPGERVSLIWDIGSRAISFTFNFDAGGWFWAAYDRKMGGVMGSGRAATIEAAVEQARDVTQLRVLAAE